MDKKELEELVSENLLKLASEHDCPIDESIALWNFLDSLEKTGFSVDYRDPFVITDHFEYHRDIYELIAWISKEEVLNDRVKNLKSPCLKSLARSASLVIDRLHSGVRRNYHKSKLPVEVRDVLSNDKDRRLSIFYRSIKKTLFDYFNKYFESVLLDRGGNSDYNPNKKCSEILSEIYNTGVINLERISFVIAEANLYGEKDKFAEFQRAIEFLRYGKRKGRAPVNPEHVKNYIWGVYLLELARQKGYEIEAPTYNEGSCLERVCKHGSRILRPM